VESEFESFARYWGFEPRLCQPYRAHTKGKVESGVKYVKRNFVPGRVFADLADFNEQLRAWLAEVADIRIHGTTHEQPMARFAREASALVQTLDRSSFFQALRRSRVVAEDWLVAIDANRYSVPWRLIGKTVEVVRVGALWQITHQGQVVAEHAVLAGRHQLSVQPAHGPGAVARNARTRFADTAPAWRQTRRRRHSSVSRCAISTRKNSCWRSHESGPTGTPRRTSAQAATVQEPRAAGSSAAGRRRS
jgi:hypothetical protein